ncbi:DNA-binding transcriptional regulator, LysR family [Luteibacter sp. UNCMF331Sha3.1]|uniref:LysR family transcriptional regulator n=1 Tax=Luteibacter sp. UNCMF331Sha3.1 TaxID=1502760 RepID=UPI0008BC0328|nr:LysR family transcriptional regulator [Luteibacter sp. UNCMF331Sha3.1]SEM55371.1 DNA-binding transcriptional regulator, LysR family [Luteibacter sp. UNCMF331Sha3.1]
MRPENLSHLAAFAAVARHASFRKAGAELTLTTSAISYAIRNLEERLGVVLFHRTTRSVSLTEAGQRLLERLEPALADVGEALEEMNNFRATPAGTLRINMPRVTAQLLLPGLLPRFLERYPDIHFEAVDNDGLIDIVASGFDAGIRFHEHVPEDMIAVPLGGQQQGACVASPAYIAAQGVPRHPNDLFRHDCIRFRFPSGRLYKWEFEQGETKLELDVRGRVTFGDLRLALDAALAGIGFTLVLEDQVTELVAAGRLVKVLEDWCPPYPGFVLYYPRQRRVTSALRAFIEFVRDEDSAA